MNENTMNSDDLGKAMQAAWGRVKKSEARLWGDWMIIGDGLMEGRVWAMRRAGTNVPEGKGYIMAYNEWLNRWRVTDIDKSVRAKLLNVIENRAEVEEWRSVQPDKRKLNNPDVVWRKYQAATKVKKPKPRSKEAGRAQAEIDQGRERIAELEQELATMTSPLEEKIALLTDEEWIEFRDAENHRRKLPYVQHSVAEVRGKPKRKGRRTPDDLRAELDARHGSPPATS